MIELIITCAGKKEIVSAQQTGTSAIDDGSYRYSVSYRDIMVLEAERKRRFE